MKKGFSLIELLAVIVILAIIAVIATPIVLNIIDDSKVNANLRSEELYIDAVELAITKFLLDGNKIQNGTYEIMNNSNVCIGTYKDNSCSGEILEVEISNGPQSGTIKIEKSLVTEYVIDNKVIPNTPATTPASCFVYKNNYIVNENYKINEALCTYAFGAILDTRFGTGAGTEVCSGGQEYGDLILLANYAGHDLKTLIDNGIIEIINEDAETVSITGYECGGKDGKHKDVIIPSKIDGKTVTKIGAYAFYPYDFNNNSIEKNLINSVVIPNTVTAIELGAFANNTLTSVEIPDSVKSIGRDAFYSNKLTSLTLGNNVETIGKYAFQCNKLTSITIPDSVTTIKMGAFEYNNLNTVIIGSGITAVYNRAFYNGSSYTNPKTGINYGPNEIENIYINRSSMGLTTEQTVNLFGLDVPALHWNSTGPSDS